MCFGERKHRKARKEIYMDINQVWPEWHEDCVLGEGSFGKVFRAKRVEFGRTFYSAIKKITVPKNQQEIKHARSQGMNDNDIYAYFKGIVDNLLNEITLMDNLKGAQNVVGIEDYRIIEHQGEIGWDIFIRMELLTPFDSFVSNPEFSQLDVIKLGVDICSALEVCERNYIVHRDIKPDNIFISRFGEYKLGDFGIARKLEATQANLSRKGTLNYMAPEVYKSEEYGSNVDIYSLGLVLYTLLNNNRTAFLPPVPEPITYKDNESALARRLSGEAIPYPCNASPALGAIILRACAYDPRERYASATEMKNDLIREWNALIQSGSNKGINPSQNTTIGSPVGFENTTNDMTSNGRVVAGGYEQGTTVLEDHADGGAPYGADGYDANVMNGDISNVSVSQSYAEVKPVKACRIISYVTAAVLLVLSVLYMQNLYEPLAVPVSMICIFLSLVMIVSDRNRRAVGICLTSFGLLYAVLGLIRLISVIHVSFPIEQIVMLVCGSLTLFGGVTMIIQREVRFGGSLCLYSLIAYWAATIYQLIYSNGSVTVGVVVFSLAMLSVFVWSFGYDSAHPRNKLRLVLNIITFVMSGVAAVYVIGALLVSVASIM